MNYRETKLRFYPNVPPKEFRLANLYPVVKGKEDGSWYFKVRDKRVLAQGKKSDQVTASRLNYWLAAEAMLAYIADMNGEPMPATEAPRDEPKKARIATSELTLDRMLDGYIKMGSVAPTDAKQVQTLVNELAVKPGTEDPLLVREITLGWVESWINSMKAKRVTQNTIKKKVDCLKRALDWNINREARDRIKAGVDEQTVLREKPVNPLKHLDKGYQKYRAGIDLPRGEDAPENESRDRRLGSAWCDNGPLEDELIKASLKGELHLLRKPTMPAGRPLEIEHMDAMLVLYSLISNTAMRLREAYTLEVGQLDFRGDNSQIVLWKTKTDSPRSFPMFPEVQDMLREWVKKLGIEGDKKARVFPMLWSGDSSLKALSNTSSALSKKFKAVFRFCGIACEAGDPVKLTEHDLRHEGTCRWVTAINPNTGTWAYKKEECMKFTGHKREEVFFRYMSLRGSDVAARLYVQKAANDMRVSAPIAA